MIGSAAPPLWRPYRSPRGGAWHEYVGDPTWAAAILDRLIHTAHRPTLRGDSMPKRRSPSFATMMDIITRPDPTRPDLLGAYSAGNCSLPPSTHRADIPEYAAAHFFDRCHPINSNGINALLVKVHYLLLLNPGGAEVKSNQALGAFLIASVISFDCIADGRMTAFDNDYFLVDGLPMEVIAERARACLYFNSSHEPPYVSESKSDSESVLSSEVQVDFTSALSKKRLHSKILVYVRDGKVRIRHAKAMLSAASIFGLLSKSVYLGDDSNRIPKELENMIRERNNSLIKCIRNGDKFEFRWRPVRASIIYNIAE